ncbi:hypothetical protein [Spongiactinospora sp. 9N601]|uniref:hypothetical protein n=1 Tax=Spongiactinospora sp. 9N601 TaxID=3375149 RepID=UPI0037A60B2D
MGSWRGSLQEFFGDDENKGFGISQVETREIKHLAWFYDRSMYKKVRMWDNKTIAKWLVSNPGEAIKVAAMRLKFVKENYRIDGKGITWWQATIAYCFCAGKESTQFAKRWKAGFRGYKGAHNARQRYEAIYGTNRKVGGWVWHSTHEFWRCVKNQCAG